MKIYNWVVIGAGPAGILAVGKLLDAGIAAQEIAWIDPEFSVGDMGKYWYQVPSNTRVKLFNKFLNTAQAFNYQNCPQQFVLQAPAEETCLLSEVVAPLLWITQSLGEQVASFKTRVNFIKWQQGHWLLEGADAQSISAQNIIMATGAEPITKLKELNSESKIIPLAVALNPDLLKNAVEKHDKITVLGSSHSAVLVLKNLLDLQAELEIINLYRSPLCFAVDMQSWIMFDNTGLKGLAAKWAKQYLLKTIPENLKRFHSAEPEALKACYIDNKVIYAVGFETRKIPIEGYPHYGYDNKTGIIAPGLFGIGIAFPELVEDPLGRTEYNVGLYKFSVYIDKVLPIWLNYSAK
ncbi:MAG: hypothetical protein A3E87_02410 [Gammaproteobacteria bacterium RIFCSPHIGHO2_12_FULL_35_23]|nr:MAG: hypothetical protein A3E87_02410 [Gammaproteobacteria bacterium RIFCSPHIGHO2_12_FULL_35_23]